MRAAVTRDRGLMEVVAVPEPGAPGPGEVLVRPEAVGLCGSDFHYFTGDIGTIDDPSSLYPRIQGHEAAATILEVGEGCPAELAPGTRVALWPVSACGRCYACRIGRGNACANISLIGVHADGALQEQLLVPAAQVFPVGDQDPALAALIEPVSIAVRAMVRGRDRGRRAGRRARCRPDRPGARPGSDRPRRLGAARRHAPEPPRPRRDARRRRAPGRARRRPHRRRPRVGRGRTAPRS